MKTYDNSMARQFGDLLDQREAELRALAQGSQDLGDAQAQAVAHEVSDQKDAAARSADNAVLQAQSDHATQELQLVQAARLRLELKEYGRCLECGEAIDVRRLTAMPAAPYCTQCQTRHETTHAVS